MGRVHDEHAASWRFRDLHGVCDLPSAPLSKTGRHRDPGRELNAPDSDQGDDPLERCLVEAHDDPPDLAHHVDVEIEARGHDFWPPSRSSTTKPAHATSS